MDTRSKKSKAFRIWLCFFIGINIVGSFIVGGLTVINDFDIAMLGSDLKQTQIFKHTLAIRFDTLARYITDNLDIPEDLDEEDQYGNSYRRQEILDVYLGDLKDEGENLIYYAKNPKTHKVFTNSETDLGIDTEGPIFLPEGYDFYIYYDGQEFMGEKDNKLLDIYHIDSGYRNTLLKSYLEAPDSYVEQSERVGIKEYREFYDIRGCQILLAVKDNVVENPYGYSYLFNLQKQTSQFKWIIGVASIIFIIGIGLLVLSITKRKDLKDFEKTLAKVLGKLVLELKILVSIVILPLIFLMAQEMYYMHLELGHIFFFTGLCFWYLYIVWLDLRNNGSRVFSNNVFNRLVQRYRVFEKRWPFQKALLMRFYTFTALEVFLIILTGVFLITMFASRNGVFFFFALASFALGVYLFYMYARRYTHIIDDMGRILGQSNRIKQGDMSTKLQLNPDSELFILGENLNTIQEGIAEAVDKSIKSERMKVELITNVSHDLKTPLTSIISYVDLLSKEEDLSEHSKDYIRILAQKSQRLKLLIQDLFDLSKAVSGEMQFERKTLDLGKLIEQTLADLDDRISKSQLIYRVNIPEKPTPIISDGNKLYRVFLNLFNNTLKYSLVGTRVYVDLVTKDEKAVVTIKNTANYEMNFREEEIIDRFVRGDKARASEGSGLGLSIAQNFTHSCGGDFDIRVDGDLFKVILSFHIESHKTVYSD